MRALAFIIIIGLLFVIADLFPFDNLQNRIYGETIHLDALATNVERFSSDVIEVLLNHPTLERLEARAYVARAMYSCDYAFMAVPSEIEDFSRAIHLDPTYARAYCYRANAVSCLYHHGLGYNRDQFLNDFNAVINLDPRSDFADVAYDNLFAEYKLGLRQPIKAMEICNKAIASLPTKDAKTFFHMRADLYRELGDPNKAQSDESIAKILEPESISAEGFYSICYQMRWFWRLAIILAPFSVLLGRRLEPPIAIIG